MPQTPVFRTNHKKVQKGMLPYISCSDVHDYKYNIRVVPESVFLTETKDRYERMEKGEIIASYESLEDLVADDWVLD